MHKLLVTFLKRLESTGLPPSKHSTKKKLCSCCFSITKSHLLLILRCRSKLSTIATYWMTSTRRISQNSVDKNTKARFHSRQHYAMCKRPSRSYQRQHSVFDLLKNLCGCHIAAFAEQKRIQTEEFTASFYVQFSNSRMDVGMSMNSVTTI